MYIYIHMHIYICMYVYVCIYADTHTQKHVYAVSSKEILGGPRPRPLHHTAQFAPEAAAAAIQACEWMVVSGSGGVKLANIKTMRILYIYIQILVYVCMSILLCHSYVYLCLYLYNLFVYIYTYNYIHTYTYIHIYICIHTIIYIHTHTYIYIYTYIYIHIYIYTYIYIYTQYTCNAYTSRVIKVRSLTMIRWALPYITRLPPDDTKAPQRLTLIGQEMAGWTMVRYEKWMKMAPWIVNMMIDRS